jgi:hypothetical protein
LGSGRRLFGDDASVDARRFALVSSQTVGEGVLALAYRRAAA